MYLSIFLAQVIGCFVFLTSLATLVNQQRSKKLTTDLMGNPVLMLLAGTLSLIIGLLIVMSHNVWVSDWPVVVTLFGWFVLFQGLMRIFFAEAFIKLMKDLMAKSGYLLMCWVWLLVGIFLIWAGFSHVYYAM